MTKILLAFNCFFLLIGNSPERSWSEKQKLTWGDFQGEPNTDTDAVAVTASGITFSYSIKKSATQVVGFKTLIDAHFYPEHSWCKKGEVDNHILTHEQLHFDITELQARLFRERVAKLKPTEHIAETLQGIHEDINSDLAEMQEAYDFESKHSINREEQSNWEVYIRKELIRLHAFRSQS